MGLDKKRPSREVPIGGGRQFLMECPSPIIVHRCLWESEEQEQRTRGTTSLRSSNFQSAASRSRSSGAVISSLTSWDTSRPTLPMLCTSSRHRLISSRYIHHSNSGIQGRQHRPPPDTPAPQLQIKFPDCHKRQPEPGPAHHHLAETHLSCNLVWHRPYLPSSCNYRALL